MPAIVTEPFFTLIDLVLDQPPRALAFASAVAMVVVLFLLVR